MILNSVTYQPEGSSITYTYDVTAIADNAFKDHTKIVQVSIGSNVKAIGKYAFSGCNKIAGTISSSATTIGEYAFYRCELAETISLNSVTSVPEHAFERCTALNIVSLNKATSIGTYAFYYCTNLETCLCTKVTDVANYAFYHCHKLLDSAIPIKIVTIGEGAYRECYALETLDLEDCDDLESIGFRAFYDCYHITSLTTPASLETIGDYAFQYCSRLATVSLGDGLTTMNSNAFNNCTSLVSYTVSSGNTTFKSIDGALYKGTSPNYILVSCPSLWTDGTASPVFDIASTVVEIENNAFNYCSNIVTVNIPSSVTLIDGNPFVNCSKLSAIDVDSLNSNYGNNSSDGVLYLKDASSNLTELIAYPAAKAGTSYSIPSTVTLIRSWAFSGNVLLEDVTIPTSVVTIETYAFYSCTHLKGTNMGSYYELNIPATNINSWAFYNCESLQHVKFAHTLAYIDYSSFYHCDSLNCFDMANMQSTDKYYTANGMVFERNSPSSGRIKLISSPRGLVTATIPEGVTDIGYCAFYRCLVETVNLSTTVSTIDSNAFIECDKLATITATGSSYFSTDGSILYSADYKTLVLCPVGSTSTDVTIQSACETINNYAFNGCNKLTTIRFQTVPTTVGEYSFSMGRSGSTVTCAIYGCPDDKFINNTNTYTTLEYYHTLTYDLNGGAGTAPASSSNKTGETYILPPYDSAWTKDGYHAEGWCETSDGTGATYEFGGLFGMKSTDSTLYIKWVANECKIVLDKNYENNVKEDGQAYATYGSSAFSTEEGKEFEGVTRDGYTLDGYYTSATGGTKVIDSITPVGAFVPSVASYTDASGNWINTVAHEGTVTLFAQWTPIQYKVTFDKNGGAADGKAKYTTDNTTYDTGTYTGVTRTGYDLKGYYTADTGGLLVIKNDGTVNEGVSGYSDINGNWKYCTALTLTLYAQWEIVTYNITYKLDGGTNDSSNPATYDYEDDTITLLDPTKTGYEFKGWYSDSGFTTKVTTIPKNSTGDITLYAKWEIITYNITYDLDGGTNNPSNPGTYTYWTDEGTTIQLLDPTKTGYTFVSWHTAVPFTEENKVSHIAAKSTGDKNFYAEWSENQYKVVFTDGTHEEEQSFTYTESKPLRENSFVKSKYRLTGWATTSGGTKVYDDQQTVSMLSATNNDTVTLYAVWEQKGTYHAYFYDGATLISDKTITKIADETYTLPNYTSGTGSIAGWNSESGLTGTFYSVGTSMKMEEADINFYAQWTVDNAIVVHYDVNGGSTPLVDVHVVKNTSFNLAYYDGVQTGYHLLGWKTSGDETLYATGDPFTVGESDLTFVAQWAANEYTMVFEKNNTTTESGTMASQTFTYNAASTPLTSNAFVKTGYSFYGWSFTKDGTTTDRVFTDGQSIQNYTDESGKVYHLYPIWTINQYTVTADLTGGSISGGTPSGWTAVSGHADQWTKDFDYNTAWSSIISDFVGSNTLSRTGYKDPVWDKTTGNLGASDDSMTLSWTACTYTVTFDKQSGTGGSDSVTATYDSAMPTATMPTRTGYKFGGYYTEIDGSGTQYYTAAGASAKSWDIAESKTLYAKWTINQYTVTADLNSGTIASDPSGWTKVNANKYTKSFDYNTAWTAIQSDFESGGAITRTGYNTPTWDKTGNLGAANTTMKLGWTASAYTVTFDKQSGTGGSDSVNATYDSAMPSATMPTRAGYTFGGYFTQTAGAGTKYYNADGTSAKNWNIAENTTLYAKWTANTYDLTLDRQSGEGGSTSTTATYDAAMPAITLPTRTGYTFDGYYTQTSGAGTKYYNADGTSAKNWTETSVTTLYAKWIADKYVVSFTKSPGSGGTDSVNATYDAALESITIPSYTGYTFMGYYTQSDGLGTKYYNADGEGATPWKETSVNTLFAYWKANDYTVKFDKNGGTGTMTDQAFVYDTAQNLSANAFSRVGYSFIGWSTTSTGTVEYVNSEEVNNLTSAPDGVFNLYAVWDPISYKIDLNGHGAEDGFLYVTYDSNVISNKNLKFRTGYTLLGYYLTNDDVSTKVISYNGGQDVQLEKNIDGLTDSNGNWIYAGVKEFHAKWAINSYTVTVDLDGGTMDNVPASWTQVAGHSDQWTKSFEFNTSWDTIKKDFTSNDANAPTKTGHQDPVWSPSSGNLPAEDSTLSVSWIVTKYTVTAVLDKGTVSATPAGWTYDSINDVYTRDFDYNTSWAIIEYTFTDPSTPVYTFIGWDKEGYLGAGPETMTAQWTPNIYTVVVDLSGGVVTGTLGDWIKISDNNYVCNFPYETTWTQITDSFPAYEKQGYTFVNWTYPVEEFHEDFQTVKANWLAGTYTVTFNSNGGSDPSIPSKDVIYGQAYGELATVSKGGCVFVGWFTSNNDLVTSTTNVAIAADHTLYAQYYGDSTVHVNVPTGGPGYIVTPGPSKIYTGSSYTFQIGVTDGYTGTITVTADGKHGAITYSGDISNMTVTIETVLSDIDNVVISGIVAKQYTVTLDDGSSQRNITVSYNGLLPSDVSAPEKSGYVFAGYYSEKDGKGVMGYNSLMESQVVWSKTSNGTLYAYWLLENAHKVKYDLNGGSGTTPDTCEVLQGEQFIVSDTDATKWKYNFGGWTDGSRTYQPEDIVKMGSSDVTLRAVWNYKDPDAPVSTDFTGRVIDSYGNPFPQADIYIDGMYYTTTAGDGSFSVKGMTKDIHSLMVNTTIGSKMVYETTLLDLRNDVTSVDIVIKNYNASSFLKRADGSDLTIAVENLNTEANSQYVSSDIIVTMTVDNSLQTIDDNSAVFDLIKNSMKSPNYQVFDVKITKTGDGQIVSIDKTKNVLKLAVKIDSTNMKSICVSDYIGGAVKSMNEIGVNDTPVANSYAVDNGWVYIYLDSSAPVVIGYEMAQRSYVLENVIIAILLIIVCVISIYLYTTRHKH